jgi:hypothetical protein
MGIAFGDYDDDGFLVAYSENGNAASSMGALFRDFDNDGREDLFVTALENEGFSLFRNLGRGQFADITGASRISNESLPWSGWSTGIFDFNNGGYKDLFVAGGHVITTADGEQWNRVTTSVGYGCSSDRTVHFGLGDATAGGTLEIRWPAGIRQTLHDVPADRTLVIDEPEAASRTSSRLK